MVFKLKKFLRYILRRILFKDDCVTCNAILKMEENALCSKCLENLKNISSLKKYKNIYYLWVLDENFLKILKASQNRITFVEDLREIIVEKVMFILKNERISHLNYKNSEFFDALFNKKILKEFSNHINSENKQNLIFKEHLNKSTDDNKNTYFSLLINIKLLEN